MDPEKKVWTLFSLLNMESPKVQKVSHWLSKYIHKHATCVIRYTIPQEEVRQIGHTIFFPHLDSPQKSGRS